ncbi:ABC transporter permease [Clostridium sp. AM58-1XD]|uniref:ABC transporter permease n=1 Tax=Clostridium sp. AM58-1XD TaxID=2292307 RepID=UPI000E53503D|nr:ABC transporter permease [Clostridium sp. AM58-1XD]RGY96918.1 ABC transporter permease [Clostridium sp. AM58-1XD]
MGKYGRQTLPVLILAGIVLIWEAAVRIAGIPLYVLPSPTEVAAALFADGKNLAGHAFVTVMEALAGMGIAFVMAAFLGIAMDSFPSVKRGIYPLLVVTQTVPMIVLAPILIIYLGFGMAPKILTVVLMCFFPIVVSFVDGMEQLDEDYVNLVRSYGAGKWSVYSLVKIPAALPSMISGLKVSATYSISGAVVGEWIGSQSGLGYYLLRVKNGYMLDKVFACVLVIICLSLFMNGLIRLVQILAMPYSRTGATEKREFKEENL